MKRNTFKTEKPTRGTSPYGNSLDALLLATGVITFAGFTAIYSYKLAMFIILYVMLWILCMIRFNQSK